jgi:hypothetical protein
MTDRSEETIPNKTRVGRLSSATSFLDRVISHGRIASSFGNDMG